jgi:hypothetical protein
MKFDIAKIITADLKGGGGGWGRGYRTKRRARG